MSPLDDGVFWILWQQFSYLDEVLGLIVAPVGMETDGGSVPKLFQNLIAPLGKGLKAFVIHDALYRYQWFEREASDKCLLRALKDCGEVGIEPEVIYEAVRLGGEPAWNSHKEA